MNKYFNHCFHCHGEGCVGVPVSDKVGGDDFEMEMLECCECDGKGICLTSEGIELDEFLKKRKR